MTDLRSSPLPDRALGWEAIAGQDVSLGHHNIVRYMLWMNPSEEAEKRGMVTATEKKRTDWYVLGQGKAQEMIALFDKLDKGYEA